MFTLTCVSTGGPATTVTWTRNEAAATGVISQTLTNTLTATYVNTLIVTGREPGNYTCSVTNDRTAQPATASLTVAGEVIRMISLLREGIYIGIYRRGEGGRGLVHCSSLTIISRAHSVPYFFEAPCNIIKDRYGCRCLLLCCDGSQS